MTVQLLVECPGRLYSFPYRFYVITSYSIHYTKLYDGNKNNLTEWIVDNLPYKRGKVLDLFCGGCSVSYALKEKRYTVLSNDALYSNYT